MRMRLKASYDVSKFSAVNQAILRAPKRYGLILADNGSAVYIGRAPDPRWNNDDLHQLGQITASDFEVVQMTAIYTETNVPKGAAPSIASFTANPSSVVGGQPVTLSWSVANARCNNVTPQLGPVRGNSIVSTPGATTTYRLESSNQYGRSQASVRVTVVIR
jgi:hypothetical protein